MGAESGHADTGGEGRLGQTEKVELTYIPHHM